MKARLICLSNPFFENALERTSLQLQYQVIIMANVQNLAAGTYNFHSIWKPPSDSDASYRQFLPSTYSSNTTIKDFPLSIPICVQLLQLDGLG